MVWLVSISAPTFRWSSLEFAVNYMKACLHPACSGCHCCCWFGGIFLAYFGPLISRIVADRVHPFWRLLPAGKWTIPRSSNHFHLVSVLISNSHQISIQQLTGDSHLTQLLQKHVVISKMCSSPLDAASEVFSHETSTSLQVRNELSWLSECNNIYKIWWYITATCNFWRRSPKTA